MLLGICLVASYIIGSTVIVLAAVRLSDEPEGADVMYGEALPQQTEPVALS
jgi:hypothetical protein